MFFPFPSLFFICFLTLSCAFCPARGYSALTTPLFLLLDWGQEVAPGVMDCKGAAADKPSSKPLVRMEPRVYI